MADEEKKPKSTSLSLNDYADDSSMIDSMLYARHAEVKQLQELTSQRGTPIPALFSVFYKFIQNPSTVSVETYKRMVDTDDTVGSGVDFVVLCMAARLGRYKHKSPEVTEWVNKVLGNMRGGWFNAQKEIYSGIWNGFSVTEKIWANTEDGFVPEKLSTLPPSTILFETDRTGEVTRDGILQYQRNWNPFNMATGISSFAGGLSTATGFSTDARTDAFAKFGDMPFPVRTANIFNYLSVRIPTQKCIHYAHDAQGKFGNPYGRSLLRRAYKYYVMKDAVLRMLAIALDRKGTPLTIVFCDPHASVQTEGTNPGGRNQAGVPNKGVRADKAALEAFKNVHNDSVIVLPGKKGALYDIEIADVAANADAFIQSLDFLNKSLTRSLLMPGLIFSTGDGSGSWALGETHQDTWERILDGILEGPKQTIIDQLIREMLAYNFPRSAWERDGLGTFEHNEFNTDEKKAMMEIYASAIDKGVVDQASLKDLNKMRASIGFDPVENPIAKPDAFGGLDGSGEGGELGDGFPTAGGDGKKLPPGKKSAGALSPGHKGDAAEKDKSKERKDRKDGA